ncbi:HipA domain-containing protein [Mucilaginibacter sp. 21P]|uniref:type II toxin-antitoxin system HipA family toxin n=1 Tax=Mucilaginibacter sp. 21P TaxID=2778902 RepID=UPI001C596B25|nr:HipA domain-containing protein [Mucilaginibacter sp. 21P]QXV66866.1 HipA domain-containing protein [Mucilaginibacter sp. 21P]
MEIYVYADWNGLDATTQIGVLHAELVRGKEIFSFNYNATWLQNPQAQLLDPDLQLFAGPQYLNDGKPNFGMFLDSSPDRWGRVLMKRREAILARREERKARPLFEQDFLLGVFDGIRMGGLRFKTNPEGIFMNDEQALAAPPWVSLRDLEFASQQVERDKAKDDSEELKWLNMLMAPGASLGGARPKASVTDPEGDLWIAKFPSVTDEYDMAGWEMVVLRLARTAGLKVPDAQVQKFSGNHYTFLSKRFDRMQQIRIHFASAMTLLGQQDGADFNTGASYLDLVSVIQKQGRNVDENLKELWSRIVFNILVKNTDDHLRNHGFLLRDGGWDLSPAYDINPNPYGTGLTLNISEDDNSLDTELALEVATFFRLNSANATKRLEEIKEAVKTWRDVAANIGLSRRDQELMADAFES